MAPGCWMGALASVQVVSSWISTMQSTYICVHDLVAEMVQGFVCEPFRIKKPLSSAPLRAMILNLMECMEHNDCAELCSSSGNWCSHTAL